MSGTLGSIGGSGSSDFELEILCDDAGSFLRHYVRNGQTGSFTVNDTALDGVTNYAPVGAVSLCQSKSDQLSVELLCDDNGSFFRQLVRNSAGIVTSHDVALDGVTSYVTVGTVYDCRKNKKCNTCR